MLLETPFDYCLAARAVPCCLLRRFKQAWGQTVGKEWRSGGAAGRQQLQP